MTQQLITMLTLLIQATVRVMALMQTMVVTLRQTKMHWTTRTS